MAAEQLALFKSCLHPVDHAARIACEAAYANFIAAHYAPKEKQ